MDTIDPTQAPEAQFKYIERNLDVPLCEGEIMEAAKKLAAADEERFAVEREKSQASQGYAKRLRELTKVIARYSMQINSGFEERVVKCKVQFNYPSEGEKTITRLDNDAVIEVLSMADDELQEVLPFNIGDGNEDDTDLGDDDDEGLPGESNTTKAAPKAEAAA
jgi:hypothetical protein